MAKTVIVFAEATIIDGPLKGISGKVVGYDYVENEVDIEIDEFTTVTTTSEMIKQNMQELEL